MRGLLLAGVSVLAGPPAVIGDPDEALQLAPHLEGALRSTEAFGSLPSLAWRVQLHPTAASFERATGSPPARAAAWVGLTLHLRPWDQLRRRDLGRVLRHELTHLRLRQVPLRRWEEEARCLWAEVQVRPPAAWPEPPEADAQAWLDRALARGTTASQALAYRWLRAWLHQEPLPPLPGPAAPPESRWKEVDPAPVAGEVQVQWTAERLPTRLEADGWELPWGRHELRGPVTLSGGLRLDGRTEAEGSARGWTVTWHADTTTWVAAAVAGELGDAPFEAKRALAAVLARWREGPGAHRHAGGVLCPLTHCAVVRGSPDPESLRAAREAPRLGVDAHAALFHGSAGGRLLSVRQVWGRGTDHAGRAAEVTNDRWSRWTRTFSPAQVAALKAAVRPGLRPGQLGLHLGASGPYAVESLRLAAGRSFGWTAWPSNACEAKLGADGTLVVHGKGWGHNVGLCLQSARHWAKAGWSAERILEAAFGARLSATPSEPCRRATEP